MLNAIRFKNDLLSIYSKLVHPKEELLSRTLDTWWQANQASSTYFSQLRGITDDIMGGLSRDIMEAETKAIVNYLNGMEDITGDSLFLPFYESDIFPFIESISLFGNIESYSEIHVKVLVRDWNIRWASLFPRSFNNTMAPPGSVRKISSIITSPVLFPSPDDLFKSDVSYHQEIIGIFQLAAQSLKSTIVYMVPTPTGPVVAPAIIAPIR